MSEDGLVELSYANLTLPVGDELWSFKRLRIGDQAKVMAYLKHVWSKELVASMDGQLVDADVRAKALVELAARPSGMSDVFGNYDACIELYRLASDTNLSHEAFAEKMPPMSQYDMLELALVVSGSKSSADPPTPRPGPTAIEVPSSPTSQATPTA